MRLTLHRRPISRRPCRMTTYRTCDRAALHRSSTPWRDGIGAGYAVGPTERVIDLVTHPPGHESFSGSSS